MRQINRRNALNSIISYGTIEYFSHGWKENYWYEHQEFDGDIEIAIYVTEQAMETGSISAVYKLCSVIEDFFRESFPDIHTTVTYKGTVAPSDSTNLDAEIALHWWEKYDHSSSDANLLLFSRELTDWDYYGGYASFSQPAAVSYGFEYIQDDPPHRRLAAHEIGHMFGLIHGDMSRHDDAHTIMEPDVCESKLVFSDISKRKLREDVLG